MSHLYGKAVVYIIHYVIDTKYHLAQRLLMY